jgi:hypothetical protein
LTALPISIPTIGTTNLGKLFEYNPAILQALDSYAEYGRMMLLFFEASVLGLLSIAVSFGIDLNDFKLRSPRWWLFLFFKVVVLVWLGGWLFGGYRRYSARRDDPARTSVARKYWHRAVTGDAASALLEIFH